jgi:hypothetical protein
MWIEAIFKVSGRVNLKDGDGRLNQIRQVLIDKWLPCAWYSLLFRAKYIDDSICLSTVVIIQRQHGYGSVT